MSGKGGKHGPKSKRGTVLPTSAARRRYLEKRRRAAKSRTTARTGRRLNTAWAKQFVDAGYKYVFVEVPIKGNIPSTKVQRFPGAKETRVPARLSKFTPEADIIFGNDLNDLKFFDSKRQSTTSFSKAQRMVYPQINKNGGVIVLEEGTSLRNLADGQMVEIDGIKIKPGTAHVGFHVDLSAVASGQKELDSLLNARSGNLHPPASDLDLEDSRMVSERRARYRNKPKSKTTPKRPNAPKPTVKVASSNIKKPVIPKKVGLPVGLAANVIIEYTIGKTIQKLEQELDETNANGIKMLWKSEIFPKIEEGINLTINLERYRPDYLRKGPVYIKLDWEVLLRLQMKDTITDAIVWAFKFVHGNPGFAEVFEGVNYVGHEAVGYGEDHISKNKPKKRTDSSDNTLVREFHRDFILIWDPKVHRIAVKYRNLALKVINQLNVVFDKTMEVIKTISSNKNQSNAEKHLTARMDKIAKALNRYDFKDAKKQTLFLVFDVNGQLEFSKVYQYRIEKVQNEITVLKSLLSETFELRKLSKKQKENQQDLLAMYMGQDYDNLY